MIRYLVHSKLTKRLGLVNILFILSVILSTIFIGFNSTERIFPSDQLDIKEPFKPLDIRNYNSFFLKVEPSKAHYSPLEQEEKVNYQIDVIGVYIGTHNQKKNCTLQMVLNEDQFSDIVDCHTIEDNSFAPFHFKKNIREGVHEAKIIWHPKDSQGFVAVYAAQGNQDDVFWLRAGIPRHKVSYLRIFKKLAQWYGPVVPFLFAASIFIATTLIIFRRKVPLLTFAILALFIHIMIATPYSGFDETAHIDMAFSKIENTGVPKKDFYEAVYDDLVKYDFTSLHSIKLGQRGQCPHSLVLWGCGAKNQANPYYSYYGKFASKFFSDFSPQGIRVSFFVFQVIIFCLFSALLLAAFGIKKGSYLLTIVLMLDAITSKIIFINNDFPMFLFGAFLAVYFLFNTLKFSWIKLILSTFLVLSSFYLVKSIDKSNLAALPAIFLIPAIYFSRGKFSPRDFNFQKFIVVGISLLISATIIVFLAKGFFQIINLLFDFKLKSICSGISSCNLLDNLTEDINPLKILKFHMTYLKSLMGSYIWGHSYGPSWIVYSELALFTYFLGKGFMTLESKPARIIILLLMAVSFLIINIAYLPGSADLEIVRDSFLKPRMTAPGVYAFLIFPMLGIIRNNSKERLLIALIFLFKIMFVFPQVYVAEAF